MDVIKKLFHVKNIKIAVVGAGEEIKRLLHLWSVAEQGGARELLEQRFVDVQEMAKDAWKLATVPSLENMCQRILGGPKIVKFALHDGGGKTKSDQRYKVLCLSLSLSLSLFLSLPLGLSASLSLYTHTPTGVRVGQGRHLRVPSILCWLGCGCHQVDLL
jgi:hypothetical protein